MMMRRLKQDFFKLIIKEMKENNTVTEISLAAKFKVSERTIRRYIKILKDEGKISLDGYGEKRIWKVL